MARLRIEGGRRLSGRVTVDGNKNAALPLLAACLLTDQECVLRNMPRIRDVEVMARLLESVGARVDGLGTDTVRVRCDTVSTGGGDFPARRTITTHLRALSAMGAVEEQSAGAHCLRAADGLRPASLYLDEASVTGTETALLAAATAPGPTEIRHAACEPHVVELCAFLTELGVGVEGAGSPTIRVHGGSRLSGADHTLSGDYIEAGSWAVVAAVTGGAIEVLGARADDIEPIVSVLRDMQVRCSFERGRLAVEESRPRAVRRITTGVWPAFPSDIVSLVTVLATQAEGRTLVHDWMYELRLFALEQLSGMRADLFLCDPHRIIVTGATKLRGRSLDSRDLRSGMALIAAALAADGESVLSSLEMVERGYGALVERLEGIGAQVAREA